MIAYLVTHLWLIWTFIFLLCLILELSSGDFYVICLAVGAVVPIVVSFFTPLWLQILLWALSSVFSIWLVRPWLVRHLRTAGDARLSNADALIGRIGVVIVDIPADASGYVKVDGDEWKAVSQNGMPITSGSRVEIVSRESIIVTVKLI